MSDVTEDSLLIAGGRRPGRPLTVCAERGGGSTVTVYLPKAYHDRLSKLASLREDQSISAVVRELLRLRLPSEFSTDK